MCLRSVLWDRERLSSPAGGSGPDSRPGPVSLRPWGSHACLPAERPYKHTQMSGLLRLHAGVLPLHGSASDRRMLNKQRWLGCPGNDHRQARTRRAERSSEFKVSRGDGREGRSLHCNKGDRNSLNGEYHTPAVCHLPRPYTAATEPTGSGRK